MEDVEVTRVVEEDEEDDDEDVDRALPGARRIHEPKHNLAPRPVMAYGKYGDEHYPEETVPSQFTCEDAAGHQCRYITNFLVYNKRGERLMPIDNLKTSKAPALCLYGQLLSIAFLQDNNSKVRLIDASATKAKKRKILTELGDDAPYPVRADLAEWQIEYGSSPSHTPALWLVSTSGCYYKLEKPAGRYNIQFDSMRFKFDVVVRILKTLQAAPMTSLAEMEMLLEWGVRNVETAMHIRQSVEMLKNVRTVDEETSSEIAESNFEQLEKTPWGASYKVDDFRPSVLHKLADFIQRQAEFFVQHVTTENGGVSLLATPLMQQLAHEMRQPPIQDDYSSATTYAAASSGAPTPGPGSPYASNGAAQTVMMPTPAPYEYAGHYADQQMAAYYFPQGPLPPRVWMRTELHVSPGKAILNYYQLSLEEQMQKPCYLGEYWLSPRVANSYAVNEPNPPLPADIPLILPERPEPLPPPHAQSHVVSPFT